MQDTPAADLAQAAAIGAAAVLWIADKRTNRRFQQAHTAFTTTDMAWLRKDLTRKAGIGATVTDATYVTAWAMVAGEAQTPARHLELVQ